MQGRWAGGVYLIVVVITSILDVEVQEAGWGEMRDVIKVDELSEGLLAAVLGPVCSHGFGFGRPARRVVMVQRYRAAHQW